MAEDIDYKIIERQLAILMTNSVAFSSKLYDMFVSSTPMDVEFNVWTSVNDFQTITVPNRAKGNIPASYGNGTPNGEVEASYGTMYLDRDDGSIYIKTTLEGNDGWLKVITETDLTSHDKSNYAHDGKLAKITGAYTNNTTYNFVVKDVVEDVLHDESKSVMADDTYYAVNKGSLFKLLGGLENVDYKNRETDDGLTIVTALNEIAETSHFDTGCASNGAKNARTNNSAIISKEENTEGGYRIVLSGLSSPATVIAPNGKRYDITTDVSGDTNTYTTMKNGGKYSIYIDLDSMQIRVYNGNFYRQARRPYVLKKNDGWLDTNSLPGKFYFMEVVTPEGSDIPELTETEKNWVFLGYIEQYDEGAEW